MATVTKNIETRVKFSNDDLILLLQKAAGAPGDVKGTVYFDEDSFYGDLEIVWWEKKQEEVE